MSEAEQHVIDRQFAVLSGGGAHWPFCLSTWITTYRQSEHARSMRPAVFAREHHDVAARLLLRCELKVASPVGDSSLYLGWALRDGSVLHYVFVKPAFRGMGIARALLGDRRVDAYSHRIKGIERLLGDVAVYNPYLSYEPAP